MAQRLDGDCAQRLRTATTDGDYGRRRVRLQARHAEWFPAGRPGPDDRRHSFIALGNTDSCASASTSPSCCDQISTSPSCCDQISSLRQAALQYCSELAGYKMEWVETTPGHWTRPMDAVEAWFDSASSVETPCGIAHAMVSAGARLPAERFASVERFRRAWTSLRYDHPRIACYASSGVLHYTVPDSGGVQQWLSQTLIVDESGASGLELLATLKSRRLGVLVLLPQSWEVFVQVGHNQIDGVGAMLFLNCLLDALRHPVDVCFGDEHRNLSRSLTHTLQLPPSSRAEVQTAQAMVAQFASSLPGLRLAPRARPTLRHAVRMERLEFTASQTEQIRLRARLHDITVTHACHAAMIQTLSSLDGGKGNAYASLFYFSLRGATEQAASGTASPVSVHLTALPAVVSASSGAGFLPLARRVKDVYTQRCRDAGLHGPLYNALAPVLNASSDGQARLSSLGVVDERVPHALEDFWIGAGSATADMTTYVWTFRGRLCVATWFNEAFYERGAVKHFLSGLRSALLLGLQIGDSGDSGGAKQGLPTDGAMLGRTTTAET
jgi:hypothetical protein